MNGSRSTQQESFWLVLALGGMAVGAMLGVASYFFDSVALVLLAVVLAIVSTAAAGILGFMDARATGRTVRASLWAATKAAFVWVVPFP